MQEWYVVLYRLEEEPTIQVFRSRDKVLQFLNNLSELGGTICFMADVLNYYGQPTNYINWEDFPANTVYIFRGHLVAPIEKKVTTVWDID